MATQRIYDQPITIQPRDPVLCHYTGRQYLFEGETAKHLGSQHMAAREGDRLVFLVDRISWSVLVEGIPK